MEAYSMKQWIGNVEDLREAYKQISEDITLDHKPRSLEVKITVNRRSLELNAVLHIVIRQIRKHLFDSGLGYVEYEDEATGKLVRMPLDEEMVKELVKDKLGVKFQVMGISLSKPTRIYTHDEMLRVLRQIEVWAANDLGLQIVYKDKVRAINEKYKDDS